MTDLLSALGRAREAAESHMAASDADDAVWHEETVTDILLRAARPHVSYAAFNRHQESRIGADWLWWWIDESGECFGMLAQAKRLHRRSDRFELDFRADGGEQMRRLLSAADVLAVPAMYVLYLGTAVWRAPMTCGADPHPSDCERCRRATVSVLTAIQAQMASRSARDAASVALLGSTPLEDLADPATGAAPVYDLHLNHVEADVRAFLSRQQAGARHVARAMFARVAQERMLQLTAAIAERVPTVSDAVFAELPDDAGHFPRPYYVDVLRGLRRQPPDYLADALEGNPPPVVASQADGVIVVRI